MEEYKQIKDATNDKLIFKMSQLGFALHSDLLFTTRLSYIPQDINMLYSLNHGDKVFISVLQHELNINLEQIVRILDEKKIKVYFYLMYEPIIPQNIIDLLLPVSICMFINNNVYDHPQIHMMPIGIRDCEKIFSIHQGFSHDYLFNEGSRNCEKEILCLLCFSYTHDERRRCYSELNNRKYITNLNDGIYENQPSIHCGKVPVWINYEYTHKSYFTLSPRGYGEDCHRFYESIYLKSTPIVKKTNTAFDKLFNIFPCLMVDDWSDVTEEFLLENKEKCQDRMEEFHKKYINVFTDLNSIHELLIQT
jgi:hypothetical protein